VHPDCEELQQVPASNENPELQDVQPALVHVAQFAALQV